MRCTGCGWPLSPSRTHTGCPRCGTPIHTGQKATSTPVQRYQQAYWESAGVVETGTPTTNDQWAHDAQGSSYNTSLPQMSQYQPGIPHQFPQQMLQQRSQSGKMWLQGSVSHPGFSPGTSPHIQVKPLRQFHNTKLGFTTAGLCVLVGGLILVFVYFIAIGLPWRSPNTKATTISTPKVSTTIPAPSATAIPSPPATTYPGQQYIDNAHMASTINTNNLQPTQLTTIFKINQKIYVTFQLHPQGHSGAVCLLWYLKSKQVANFSFTFSANSKLSYAYSIYGGAGPAYVEIYWAGTTQCINQVLAQHVDFTVTT